MSDLIKKENEVTEYVAVAMNKGRKKKKTIKDKRSTTLSPDVVEKVKAQAEKENRSFSNMLETMAIKYLEEDNKKQ